MGESASTPEENTAPRTLKRLKNRFSRAVGYARAAIFTERAIPRLVPPAATGALYASASWLGMWDHIPHEYRPAVVAAFALTAAVSPFLVKEKSLRVSEDDVIKRLQDNLGNPEEQPVRMMRSKLAGEPGPESRELWDINEKRLWSEWGDKVKAGKPHVSKTSAAAAAIMALSVALTGVIAGEERIPRLQQSFEWTAPPPPAIPAPPPEIRAWVTPPEQIESAEPLFLTNMAVEDAELAAGDLTAYEQSTLSVAVYGGQPKVTINGTEVEVARELPADSRGRTGYEYVKTELPEGDVVVEIEDGPTWNITVSSDQAPTATITQAGDSRRYWDQLQIRCKAEDDSGLNEGRIEFSVPGAREDAAEVPSANVPPVTIPGASLCR